MGLFQFCDVCGTSLYGENPECENCEKLQKEVSQYKHVVDNGLTQFVYDFHCQHCNAHFQSKKQALIHLHKDCGSRWKKISQFCADEAAKLQTELNKTQQELTKTSQELLAVTDAYLDLTRENECEKELQNDR